MRIASTAGKIPADIRLVWKLVTDTGQNRWRSDLNETGTAEGKGIFVERRKDGMSLRFTVTEQEPPRRYEAVWQSRDMTGRRILLLEEAGERITKVELTETVQIRDPVTERLSLLFSDLKGQQEQYLRDLAAEVQRRRAEMK